MDFRRILDALGSDQVWEIAATGTAANVACGDIPQATFDALTQPLDFPPLTSAIVPGDRVALAMDPNCPSIDWSTKRAKKPL